jgi:hypothetical protein
MPHARRWNGRRLASVDSGRRCNSGYRRSSVYRLAWLASASRTAGLCQVAAGASRDWRRSLWRRSAGDEAATSTVDAARLPTSRLSKGRPLPRSTTLSRSPELLPVTLSVLPGRGSELRAGLVSCCLEAPHGAVLNRQIRRRVNSVGPVGSGRTCPAHAGCVVGRVGS